ncbi:TIGR03905 family TSCPD domain-containing protein [Inconstantimicrobium mannanitabidum]|uniref:TSCPD domain-containing protein n=1 Tax=Inconstantimicrobium mannanitabidum TaxID=1604901 RepID=A0ACB5RA58_9CLOT|nr:TIGR03905 family TSCPD domain-containing protein [Clostridium sp. TW13]GKX66067.1 TSCPD domain-containing protein [Clostridium sp. TW13]
MYSYTPKGVCSRQISFDIVDNKVTNISFVGGCNGNLQGLSALADGMTVDEVIEKLSGIDCGNKGTSCPAQLAEALKSVK